MTQILKFVSRFIVSVAVCVVILYGLIAFVPPLTEKVNGIISNETENIQLKEPTVIWLTQDMKLADFYAKDAAELEEGEDPTLDISFDEVFAEIASEQLKNVSLKERLDEQFWQTATENIDCVFTYKGKDGVYAYKNFNLYFHADEIETLPEDVLEETPENLLKTSEWMIIFSSHNSSGEWYKAKIYLRLLSEEDVEKEIQEVS